MEKPRVEITDWSLGISGYANYNAEMKTPSEVGNGEPIVLFGVVTDHPRAELNRAPWIRTSKIVSIDVEAGVVETLNTTYLLKGPCNQSYADFLLRVQP